MKTDMVFPILWQILSLKTKMLQKRDFVLVKRRDGVKNSGNIERISPSGITIRISDWKTLFIGCEWIQEIILF